jgi:probable O-glycosylation ligase (exosortase A-associated)
MYLSRQMTGARLNGPGENSIYSDENTFSMLFVTGIPFLFYTAQSSKRWYVKCLLLLVVPFAWHAVFLTGSRGGLVGIAAITIVMGLRSKKKILVTGVLASCLIAAFIYQGGYLRKRSTTMVEYEEDGSAMGRINAWKAGFEMAKDHPLTGVGIGNFMTAYPKYSNTRVRVAHNTIVQLFSETGFLSSLAYLLLFWTVYRQGRKLHKTPTAASLSVVMINIRHATECSLFGFFICSLFLNLGTFEIFYYILIVHAVWLKIYRSSNQINEQALLNTATPNPC